MHDPRKSLECIFVGDLRIRPRKRSEALVIPHENLVVVVLVADGDIWLHDVKAVAVDGVNKLQQFLVNKILNTTEAEGTYRNAKRPDIRCCSPWKLHLSFGAPENWTTNVVSIFGMSGLLAHRGSKICKLDLGDLSLRFICVVDEYIVGLDVCMAISIGYTRDSVVECCKLTSMDKAFGMKCAQSLEDAFRNELHLGTC